MLEVLFSQWTAMCWAGGFTLAAGAVARVPWQLNLGGNGEGWGGLE